MNTTAIEESALQPGETKDPPLSKDEDRKETYAEMKYRRTEEDIIDELVKGKNVFLSGSGGTGKSYLIKSIYHKLKDMGITVFKTGSTGVAAVNIDGMTLHSWAGVQLGDKDAMTYFITITGRNKKAQLRWKATTVLIIDEISMIGGKFFAMLTELGRLMRKNNAPFGKISLLICGDVCQLPPVKDIYFFKADCYEEYDFQVYILDKPWRFQKDLAFFDLLSRVRRGEMTPEDIALLKTRQDAYYRDIVKKKFLENEIKPTRIYSKKIDVHEMNMSELAQLKGQEFGYQADDNLQKKHKAVMSSIENYQDLMNKNVPAEISLKKGAQVMLTWNLDVERGLCNGSRGVVLECYDEAVLVKFKNGEEILVTGNVWTIEDEDVIFTRCQIPLILAWAYTIHKSQSATLDSAIIDLGTSLFSPNMGYVALSRCRSLDGVYIINIIPEKITCDPEAKEFERFLREMAVNYYDRAPGEVSDEEEGHQSKTG